MFNNCRLPPLYHLFPVAATADLMGEASRSAGAGADPLTVFCAERDDALDCAVILHPDIALDKTRLIIYVAALGLGDGLGAVVPAGLDVTYRWPNIVEANLGAAGRVSLAVAEGTRPNVVPDWLVLCAEALIESGGGMKGWVAQTALRDEGDAETTTAILLESFARHLLTWINRWQDDGFDPVRAMWLRHAPSHEEEVKITTGGEVLSGKFHDIADDGAMMFGETAGKRQQLPLIQGLTSTEGALVRRWATPGADS
jgi:hypothetical protein